MSEIAPLYNNGCLERGISIMRLALGYEKGLPDSWEIFNNNRTNYTIIDEVQHVANAFPDHTTRILCPKDFAEECGLKRNQYIECLKPSEKVANNYIYAFAYITNLYMDSHFMVSNPINALANYISYAVMVSIKRKNIK